MPTVFHRHFTFGGTRTGAEIEPVAKLAKILAGGALIIAGAYFAFLYLVAGR
jgi:hypothetical protein